MKRLHRHDMYGWSQFDEARNIDFHSVLWQHPEGNIVVDPLPLSAHDQAHLEQLGGVAWIVVTNSDHVRASEVLAQRSGARIAGPALERDDFPVKCDRWLSDGEVFAGMKLIAVNGSKTPGELVLLVEQTTLITGDLIRAHEGGRLTLLPEPKLTDRTAAVHSLQRVVEASGKVDAVLLGDGWPLFVGGGEALRALLSRELAT